MQLQQQVQPLLEDLFTERLLAATLNPFRIFGKKLEVLAVVEDVEFLFVNFRAEQPLAESGSTSHHLVKLGLGADQLEEDQVHNLRHVDAGIQHIHRDRNDRVAVLLVEVINQILSVGFVVIYYPAELPLQVRITIVEALLDKHGVVVVFRKDNSLTEPVTSRYHDTVAHQVLQHLVHRVDVEQPVVQGR